LPRSAIRADGEEGPVESIVGVILIVIAALEILWVVRTVQRNMPKA
jgi:hypothetical protein